jgi:copper(I)-binding protein
MKIILSLFFVLITLAACGKTEMQHSEERGVEITSAWLREPPPGAKSMAGYLAIQNFEKDEDRLLEVKSSVAKRVEIHEIQYEGGMSRMREMENGLPVPAKGSVMLEPGGYHLMFIEPRGKLKLGDAVPLVLFFEKFGKYEVDLLVKSDAPGSHEGSHSHH